MAAVTKGHPMWCRVYARKTPAIPVHNGFDTCIGCGYDVAGFRSQHRPEAFISAPDGHRECYCGHVLTDGEGQWDHVKTLVFGSCGAEGYVFEGDVTA